MTQVKKVTRQVRDIRLALALTTIKHQSAHKAVHTEAKNLSKTNGFELPISETIIKMVLNGQNN